MKVYIELVASTSIFVSTLKYKKFLKKLKKFHVKCPKYLKSSIPNLHKEVIKSLTFLRLPERNQASFEGLEISNFSHFPLVVEIYLLSC